MRHVLKIAATLAVLLAAGWAVAQSQGGTMKAPVGAIDAVPGQVLQVVAPQTQRPSCAIQVCAAGDQTCLQGAFNSVMGCLRSGAVGSLLPDCAGCSLPAGDTKVFRAHGGGIVLYGTIGQPGPRNKALLKGIAAAVDPPLVLRGE